MVLADDQSRDPVAPTLNTVFYTPSVVNTPSSIDSGIRRTRERLRDLSIRPLRLEKSEQLSFIRERDHKQQTIFVDNQDWLRGPLLELSPAFGEVAAEYSERERRFPDPTSLILVDEADRLRIGTLEQVRTIFDEAQIGLILIGMPGLEKRLARYPQLYSRIGFVHEFRPLGAAEVRQLLDQRWPSGLNLPEPPWAEDAVAAIIRITNGKFRLLNRLLTQMERILEVNRIYEITKEVVERARETLVIGAA
jgi:AAA domain-containing protein